MLPVEGLGVGGTEGVSIRNDPGAVVAVGVQVIAARVRGEAATGVVAWRDFSGRSVVL